VIFLGPAQHHTETRGGTGDCEPAFDHEHGWVVAGFDRSPALRSLGGVDCDDRWSLSGTDRPNCCRSYSIDEAD